MNSKQDIRNSVINIRPTKVFNGADDHANILIDGALFVWTRPNLNSPFDGVVAERVESIAEMAQAEYDLRCHC